MNKIKLENLAGGALAEKFSKSFERVIENLQDQNTPYKTKRTITIKLGFEQNETRDDVSVSVDVTEKLAPQAGIKTSFALGKNLKTGEVFAEEYGKQVKGQISTEDISVDPATGEVVESEKVVDLRKIAY